MCFSVYQDIFFVSFLVEFSIFLTPKNKRHSFFSFFSFLCLSLQFVIFVILTLEKNIKRQKSRNFCRKSDFKEEPVLRMLAFLTFIFVLQVYIGKVGQIHLTARSSMETYNCFNFVCNNFVHFFAHFGHFLGDSFSRVSQYRTLLVSYSNFCPSATCISFINFH